MSTQFCCWERVSKRCPDALLSPLLYELTGPGRTEAVGPSWEPWRGWGPRAGHQQALGSWGRTELCSPHLLSQQDPGGGRSVSIWADPLPLRRGRLRVFPSRMRWDGSASQTCDLVLFSFQRLFRP